MKWATTTLILCVALLTGLGLVTLYSSSMDMEVAHRAAIKKPPVGSAVVAPKPAAPVGASYLVSQSIWLGLGLIACFITAKVDYHRWKKASPYFLIASVILLLLVFVPHIGVGVNGARRWIALSNKLHFQPSEFAKLGLIFFLAAYGERFQRQMNGFRQGLLLPGCAMAVVLGLIFIEPDRGCTILLTAVGGAMLIVAGVRIAYLIPPFLLAGAGLTFSLLHDPMRMGRIMAWMHPEAHKEGSGYQAYQALIAMGSGGYWGLGLGNGRQKLGFVPESHTDFIFAIIGEELGLVVTLLVVVCFVVFIFCGSFIARRANDTFGFLLGTGITFMIGLQAFINMGVVTSLLPNKGMPLPFISYGGSNLLLTLAAVGLLLSISRSAVEPVKKKANPFDASAGLGLADA